MLNGEFYPFPCTNVRMTGAQLVAFCDWLLEDRRFERVNCYHWDCAHIVHVKEIWSADPLSGLETFVDPHFQSDVDRIEFMLRFADALERSDYRTT